MPEKTRRLLEMVATRHRFAVLSLWFYRMILVGVGVYVVGLAAARLFAWLPNEWFTWTTVVGVPAAAMLWALIIPRGIRPADAARLVDLRMGTKDLYLTTAMLSDAPGEYKPLVMRDAEAKADGVRPNAVVPFDWSPNTTRAGLALALAVALTFVPVFDLFGKEAQRAEQAERLAQLDKQKKAAVKKSEALKKAGVEAEQSRDVKLALDQLKNSFNQMKPQERQANADMLRNQSKAVGDKWKETKDKINQQSSKQSQSQPFSALNQPLSKKWRDEMNEGKTDSLEDQFQQIKDTIQQLADEKDPAKQQELKSQIRQQLQQLQNFAQNQPGGQEMAQSLAEALQQLQTSNMDGAQKEAMDALQQTTQLSQQQMQQMAQMARDLKSLQEAMDAIQKAQQADSQQSEEHDGQQCKNCNSMSDYAKLFSEIMQQNAQANGQGQGDGDGQGDGQGLGGKGGRGVRNQPGGKVDEDDSVATDYQDEKSKSHVTAGKILLKWKTNELAAGGKADVQFSEAVREVKQGVSEAITKEQVPPGYHEVIKKYFDVMEKKAGPGNAPSPAVDDGPADAPAPVDE